MDFPKKQQQCLIPRYLLQYLQDLQISHNDPTAPWGGGGGGSYTAGDGIDITDDVISLNTTPDTFEITANTGITLMAENQNPVYKDAKLLLAYTGATKLEGTDVSIEANSIHFNSDSAPWYVNNTTHEYKVLATTDQIPSLTGYATEDWVSTELLDYAELSDLATVATTGNYNDLTNKPTIPTDTSDLTNGAGYITSSALNGYATESWVTNQGYLTNVSWSDISSKPSFATVATSGNYNDLRNRPSLATVATTGAYSDLTNKPTIPTISGSYSGSYWTNININGTSKNIPPMNNLVTLVGNQSITGIKTFIGEKMIAFKQGAMSNNNVLGFTAYKYDGTEYGNLQISRRNVGGVTNDYITLGNYSSNTTKAKVGFRIQPDSSTNSFNFVMPYGTYTNFTDNTYSTSADTTIPCAFTDGTTIVKADETGLVDISSLISGGSSTSMSNYLITFIGDDNGTPCDISIRCTLKDNSTLVPGTYTTFNQSTHQALIDYLNLALQDIIAYDYETGGFEKFKSFYFSNTTTLEYMAFKITELNIDQLAY